ncbi:hypothetical protein L6Q96_22240 [Candidatus Binatia bacterium]|nr:hypothetical protein [Candidatus Binatia bacterium]
MLALLGLQGPCRFQITQSGQALEIVNCNGVQFQGIVERSGRINAETHFSDPSPICGVSFTAQFSVDAWLLPSTATYSFPIRWTGDCPLPDCTLIIESQWGR